MNTTYRKKPVEINALQFTNEPVSLFALKSWVESFGDSFNDHFTLDDYGQVRVKTLEGTSYAVPSGYYVIRGVAGEYYPCAPDIFVKTYDKV